jgi:DNA-binding NarL/FixJ family response regulator
MTIRLLIVDDHDLVREGLRMAFAGTDVVVVAEAADGQAAFEELSRQPIDVALVDIRMPRADGFRFLQLVREAGLTLPVVLMHSVNDGDEYVRRCRELGAKGLLQKGQDNRVLVEMVQRIHAGGEAWNDSSGGAGRLRAPMI